MSTIDPSQVDPTKPVQGDQPGASPTTAVERAQRQVVQDQFTNAKTDIEGLETSINGHIDLPNPHTDSASNTDLNAHKASGDHDSRYTPAAHVGSGGAEHAIAIAAGAAGFMSGSDKTKVDASITRVEDDPNPALGGDLQTKGRDAIVTTSGDVEVGRLGDLPSGGLGAFLARTTGGAYDPGDGAIVVLSSLSQLRGTSVALAAYTHSEPLGRGLGVAENGVIFPYDFPDPGWQTTPVTDTSDYNLGAGATPGPATRITGLSVNPVQDIEAGSSFRIQANVFISHYKDNNYGELFDKNTSVEIGYGVDGVFNGTWIEKWPVGPGFQGRITFAFTTIAASQITTAQTIDIFMRRGTGEDSSCNPWVDYTASGAVPHNLIVSTPSAGGDGGSGIGKGAPFVVGDILEVSSDVGDGVARTPTPSLPVAQIARKDTAQTFVTDQIFAGVHKAISDGPTGNATLQLETDGGSARGTLDYDQGGNVLSINTFGGATFTVAPQTLFSNGAQVDVAGTPRNYIDTHQTRLLATGYQGAGAVIDISASPWTPDFRDTPWSYLLGGGPGAITINVPSSGNATRVLIVPSNITPTFSGWDQEYGNRQTGNTFCVLVCDDTGGNYVQWAG